MEKKKKSNFPQTGRKDFLLCRKEEKAEQENRKKDILDKFRDQNPGTWRMLFPFVFSKTEGTVNGQNDSARLERPGNAQAEKGKKEVGKEPGESWKRPCDFSQKQQSFERLLTKRYQNDIIHASEQVFTILYICCLGGIFCPRAPKRDRVQNSHPDSMSV